MSTSVLIDGKRYYKPGVYGKPDASAVGGKAVSFGRLAIVGSFPQLQSDVAYEFLSPQAMTGWDPSSLEFARIAKLAFKPRVGASGADRVTLLNVQTNTQAQLTLVDGSGSGSILLKSRLWGTRGNQVWVKVASNVVAGQDFTFALPGATGESYAGLTSGNVLEFLCDTAVCTDLAGASDVVQATIDQTNWKIQWEKRLPMAGGGGAASDFTPTVLPVASKLQVKSSAVTGASSVAVTGTALKTLGGVTTAFVGTVTCTVAPGGAYADIVHTADGSTYVWSEITQIVHNTAVGGTTDIRGWAIDTSLATNPPLTSFQTLADAANFVNTLNNKGFYAYIRSPKAAQIPVTEFEPPAAASSIKATSLYVKADVWAILQALSASKLVEASRAAAASRAPANTTGKLLANGNDGVAPTAAVDYPDGLSKLENLDLQRVVVLSDDIEAGKALATHCYNAAVKFGRERNGWFGCPASTSLANIQANYVNKLNDRNVTLVADKIKIAAVKSGDSAAWLDPKYLAVMAAGIQCGLKPASTLTNLVPDVLDFSHAWSDGSDEDAVIAGGICGLYKDNLGRPAFLRSVTTYVQDDNPAYSETSANDSVNTSLRDLRSYLFSLIGASIDSSLSPDTVAAMVTERLDFQVAQSWIRSYTNVAVSLQTDLFSVDYTLDEIQPVNFVVVTAHVG